MVCNLKPFGQLAHGNESVTRREAFDGEQRLMLIPASLPLGELAKRMAAHDPVLDRHQGVLLIDEEGKLAGILTRGDVVRALGQPIVPAGR